MALKEARARNLGSPTIIEEPGDRAAHDGHADHLLRFIQPNGPQAPLRGAMVTVMQVHEAPRLGKGKGLQTKSQSATSWRWQAGIQPQFRVHQCSPCE